MERADEILGHEHAHGHEHDGDLLRAIFDSSADAIMVLDGESRIVRANAQALASLGLAASQVIGQPCFVVMHRLPQPVAGCPHGLCMRTRQRQEAEVYDPARSAWLAVVVDPILDGAGNISGIIHTVKDVTARRRAEEESRLDDIRMRSLLRIWHHKAQATTLQEIMDYALEEVVAVSGSQFGYIYYYREEKQEFILHAWSKAVMQACTIAEARKTYQLRETGLWGEAVRQRQPIVVNDFSAPHPLKKGYPEGHALLLRFMTVPVFDEGRIVAVAGVANKASDYTDKDVRQLTLMMESVWKIAERKRAERELAELKDRLHQENVYLREEVQVLHSHSEIIGQSEAIRRVLSKVEQVAGTSSTVLLLGETGTGKELLATALHNLSPRRQRTMVKVNCAALPAALIESELFGREKGAYTGALTRQMGRFEMADKSTLFLDEVGELPADLQAKLLRVLEAGEMQRLGSPKTITVDVRLITATNRDLAAAVREGKFRRDLYYRLNVFPLTIPPLRQRTEDIPALVRGFVREFSRTTGKKIESISKRSLDKLMAYSWPGNIRELRNAVERAMIVSNGSALDIEVGAGVEQQVMEEVTTLEECQRRHVRKILEQTRWRIRGPAGAAELLGMKPTTLESLMGRLGLHRSGADSEIS